MSSQVGKILISSKPAFTSMQLSVKEVHGQARLDSDHPGIYKVGHCTSMSAFYISIDTSALETSGCFGSKFEYSYEFSSLIGLGRRVICSFSFYVYLPSTYGRGRLCIQEGSFVSKRYTFDCIGFSISLTTKSCRPVEG